MTGQEVTLEAVASEFGDTSKLPGFLPVSRLSCSDTDVFQSQDMKNVIMCMTGRDK